MKKSPVPEMLKTNERFKDLSFEKSVFKFSDIINFFKTDLKYYGHIDYQQDFDNDYFLRREHKHDGTFVFTYDLIGKIMVDLIERATFCKSKGWNKDLAYIVGDFHIWTSNPHLTDINDHKIQGQIEIIEIPIKTLAFAELEKRN